MKANIISGKAIKPATPTPPHLAKYSLSLLDMHMPPYYTHIVFFYPPPTNNGCDVISIMSERSCLVQKSLSETLVHFYPMAGQQKDDSFIDCNDKGAYFVEAEINCKLVDFLSNPDPELLNCFIPTNDPKTIELALNSILLVQLSIFECGGMAITLCVWHKLADGASNNTFVKSWARKTRENGEIVILPEFIGASLLPLRDLPLPLTPTPPSEKCITKRLVFDAAKIASLKAEICDAMGQRPPSRVETISAFIVKYAIAASQSKSRSFKPSLLFQSVNLRKRMVPPLSENSIGNPDWSFEVVIKESEMELHEIVANMRKALTDFLNEKASKFNGDGGYEMILEILKQREQLMNMCINSYWCTSVCRVPFYEIDFGWGKPIWALTGLPLKNLIILMDTKNGDGIEAWVTLEEQEMAIFERIKELHGLFA